MNEGIDESYIKTGISLTQIGAICHPGNDHAAIRLQVGLRDRNPGLRHRLDL